MGVNLKVRLGSVELSTPLILASGTVSLETLPFLKAEKIGAMVLKTATLKPREGNPPPRLTETPAGLLNSIGLQNPGVKKLLEELALYPKEYKLVGSVGGSSVEEYVKVARELEKSGRFLALELNVSCPNVKKGGIEFGREPRLLFDLVKEVKKSVFLPLWVKLTPNTSSLEEAATAAGEAGADVLVIANTYLGMAIDVETRKSRLGTLTGGLSGPAIKPLMLYLVYRVLRTTNLPVIASGGIYSYLDALEFLIVGASAFSLGTAMLVKPDSALEILDGLERWLEERQIGNISELIGSFQEVG